MIDWFAESEQRKIEEKCLFIKSTGCGNVTETLTTKLLFSTAVSGTSFTTLNKVSTDCLPELLQLCTISNLKFTCVYNTIVHNSKNL